MTSVQQVIEYNFHVNSSERDTGTNTNFNIQMNQVVSLLAKRGQFQVIFNNVQIPFTFYQMSSDASLNVINITVSYPGDTPWMSSITLTQGNYTPYTLLAELSNQLVAKCGGAPSGHTSFQASFNFNYTPGTGYMSFQMTSPAFTSVTLNFSTSPNKNTAGFFGINTVTPTDIVISTLGAPSYSTQPCVLNPVNYLLIRSSLRQFRNREWVVIPDDVSDIMYKIPILTNQSTWINFFQASEPVYIIDNNIQTINFYLTTNLSYNPINLQQIPWSFSFTIREVLKPDYQPLNNYHALLPPVLEDTDKTLEELIKEKQKNLDKLNMYRKKLNLPELSTDKVNARPSTNEGTDAL